MTWQRIQNQNGQRLNVQLPGVARFEFRTYVPEREVDVYLYDWGGAQVLEVATLITPMHLRPVQWLTQIFDEWPAWLDTHPDMEASIMAQFL